MATVRFQRQRRRRRRAFLFFFTLIVTFLKIYVWTWNTAARYVETVSNIVESNLPIREWQVPSIKISHRNFTFDPVIAEKSEVFSRKDKNGITAAVCHRTLFGSNITLDPLFAFVSYYRLLGFDHIFFWYRPHVANVPRFEELIRLPYVTLTEHTGGGRNEGQLEVEKECLSNSTYAADYNWALTVDADEFLWFNSHVSVKDFLSGYDSNYTFLSFGKWMYTTMHRVRLKEDSGFGLDSSSRTAITSFIFQITPNFSLEIGRTKVKFQGKEQSYRQASISHQSKDTWDELRPEQTRTTTF